jgi:hypothetical protein
MTTGLKSKTPSRARPPELELLTRPISEGRHSTYALSSVWWADRTLMIASVLLGLLHAWVGRLSLNPDGMSYLDVGDAFVHRNWAVAVNGWWSPLYAWTLGLVLHATGASPKWEFPIAHVVNFGIFVLALFALRFLLCALLEFIHSRDRGKDTDSNLASLPDWAITLIGYAVFLWISLEITTVYEVSPDLAVVACVCLSTGALLRLRNRVTLWRSVSLGLILGIGYWTKTILLPLGAGSLILAYFWMPSRSWRRSIACAALVFAVVSAPLIIALSLQKGRFTFGDSGKVNYAWAMSGAQTRNWHGEIPGAGTPKHGTTLIFQYPPIFAFDGPVVGTYPPWTDPSYWNDGIRTPFTLRRQMQVLAATVPSEVRMLFRSQPALLAGIVALAMLSGPLWILGLREFWPLLAMQILGMAAFVPIIENDRYLGGFVVVLFLLLAAALKFHSSDRRAAVCIAVAVFAAMALGTADFTIRTVTHHFAIPGNGPNSTAEDVIVAEQLNALGAQPGEKIAIIGDGTGAYWARLGRFRIVAEIMGMNHGAQQFWESPDQIKQDVYRHFAQAHANLVVSACPQAIPADWQKLSGTSFCFRPLNGQGR